MNILITGGLGFIGTNLIPKLLESGITNISVLDNESHGVYLPAVHNYVTFYRCDIRNRDEVFRIFKDEKPDIVFHFAGLVSIYDCHSNPPEAISNNIMGTINIFDACVRYGIKKCIFSESSAVYESCPLPRTGYEETQSDPVTLYAVTKASAALIAKSYSQTRNFKYTALRYFNVAGPLQDYKRTIPPLFAGVALRFMGNKNPIIFGDGHRRRDFIHVDDVNNFHMICLYDNRTNNETYNVGLGKSTSLFEIIDIIRTYMGSNNTDIEYKEEINGEAFEIFANIEKAKSLGWKPEKTINDAIVDTIEFLKNEEKTGSVKPDQFMDNLDLSTIKIG